jgi:hypothetical protein
MSNINNDDRLKRIIKLFPNVNINSAINYIDFAQDGMDGLSDKELDDDLEDFCSK